MPISFQNVLENRDHAVGELARLDFLLGGGFDHFDSVLVGAGEEEGLLAVSR